MVAYFFRITEFYLTVHFVGRAEEITNLDPCITQSNYGGAKQYSFSGWLSPPHYALFYEPDVNDT
jgi:hypothetical protein